MKLLLAILCVMLMSAYPVGYAGSKEEEVMEVSFYSGEYDYKNWDDPILTNPNDAVPDEQTAKDVATALFSCIQREGRCKEFVLKEVFFDIEDEVWIVSFWENYVTEEDEYLCGPSYSIAFKKKDAQVLRMWMDE